jgi:hypothetical protein
MNVVFADWQNKAMLDIGKDMVYWKAGRLR